ncbi:RICIN domain-containing protein [Streptomyces nojiriensis]|uniref:RICIN domain-containing protein n=1 Tax=Streptomyces nojiriensis TaxID=66374 RepID=UPI00365040E3
MKPWIIRSAMGAGLALSVLLGQAASAQAAAPAAGSADVRTTTFKNHFGKCLTIENGSLRNDAPAVVSDCDEELDNQIFELMPVPEGGWKVRAKHSGRCLKITGEARRSVVQAWCSDDENQRWDFIQSEYGRQLNSMAAPWLCVWSGQEGGPAELGTCAVRPTMFWRFTT